MNKNRQIISELQSFFQHNDASKAIRSITTVMDRLTIQSRVVGPVKNQNCKFTFVQVGKVFSHTAMKSILGFKAMFLC